MLQVELGSIALQKYSAIAAESLFPQVKMSIAASPLSGQVWIER